MKYSRCDNTNICTDLLNKMTTTSTTATAATAATTCNNNISNLKMTTMSPVTSSGFLSDLSPTPSSSNINNNNNAGTQFSEEFRTVENLYEKWSDCERTVVLYALLKRLRYPCLKFLQYSIDNNLTQHAVSQSTMNAVIADINANNPSYLQNLFNAYNTFHFGDIVEAFSSTSSSASSTSSSSCTSDKESMPCYGSADFQLKPNTDERKLYAKKEDILLEVLNILPLLKPGNEDAKTIYLSLIPKAVKDTIKQIVPPELVQQIFSYLLIHPAVTSDDRRSLSVWLRQLEDFLHCSQRAASSFFLPNKSEFHSSSNNSINTENLMVTSVCSASSSCSSSSVASCNSAVNANISICGGNNSITVSPAQRNNDWQTIAPPAKFKQHYQLQPMQKQQQQQQPKMSQLSEWCDALTRRRQSCGGGIATSMTDQLCDNFNGITLNELGSSHSNSLGLSSLVGDSTTSIDGRESSLVNGVVAAAASAEAAAAASQSCLYGGGGANSNININTNPIINIIANSNSEELVSEDHDTSFSKNGTDFDFEPQNSGCNNCTNLISQFPSSKEPFVPSQPFSSLFVNNIDQMDANRWSLDSKIAALKTRRSNSLTTQTISTSSSSNSSSVVTVNDNCSNSTENLAQFANKPRSFSLSIENQQQRGALINGGSDTLLDDFKPSYIKFQTRNVGMSTIGTWLKSLRLHKYVELFYNLTYEDMLQITEEYLQNLGVTKGASHKLALCIEKLKERSTLLAKLEQDLLSGKQPVSKAIEDLTNIVLTPMKPIESAEGIPAEDNVALLFLRAIELVCTMAQRDPYVLSEDESLNSIVWILDRAMHAEAFVGHINQLKDLKFQISKLKIAFAPRLHYSKNGGGGTTNLSSLNKARWNGKPRKCDSKNGSNDRINYRKNSGDMLNFQGQQNNVNDYSQMANGCNEHNLQYKNSAFSNYMHNQQQQQSQSQQQSQFQPHIAQQQNHFPSLPQPSSQSNQQLQKHQIQHHQQQQQNSQQQQQQQQQNGRSLSNLILVSGGPQQPQKMVFKTAGHQQGVLSMTNSIRASADNLQTENVMHHQQRKGSLASVLNHNNNNNSTPNIINSGGGNKSNKNGSLLSSSSNAFSSSSSSSSSKASKMLCNNNNSTNNPNTTINDSPQQQQQQQQQQQKKTMAAVVMVSNENLNPQKIASSITTDNLIINTIQQQYQNRQQTQQLSIATISNQLLLDDHDDDISNIISKQQLQLLAAAAAVASCSNLQNENNLITSAAACCICNNNNNSNCSRSCSISSSISCNHNNPNNNSNSNNNNNVNCDRSLQTISLLSNCFGTNVPTIPGTTGIYSNCHNIFSKDTNNNPNKVHDMKSLEQLETLCLQVTEQAIN